MNTDNYNPDYELYLETTNKIIHLETILQMIELEEISKPEYKAYYKTIEQLCNNEIRKLMEIIHSTFEY